MAQEATINVRMPEMLKMGGTAVLDRLGVSPTQLVRSLYRYIEQEQKLPECLDACGDTHVDAVAKKRQLARSVAGMISLSEPIDVKALREERIEQKYGDLL